MTDLGQGDLFSAKRRRDAGAATALGVVPRTLADALRAAINQAGARSRTFTIDDVYDLLSIGQREQLENFPNAIGGAIIAAAKRHEICSTSRVQKSRSPSARGRNVIIWEREDA